MSGDPISVVRERLEHARDHFAGWPDIAATYDSALAALASLPAAPEHADSYDDIWDAFQTVSSAAATMPWLEVKHEGGIHAVAQNIVDAIRVAKDKLASLPAAAPEAQEHANNVSVIAEAMAGAKKYPADVADLRDAAAYLRSLVSQAPLGYISHITAGQLRSGSPSCALNGSIYSTAGELSNPVAIYAASVEVQQARSLSDAELLRQHTADLAALFERRPEFRKYIADRIIPADEVRLSVAQLFRLLATDTDEQEKQ